MNPEIDDQMVLISQYYPDEIYSHFVPTQDEVLVGKRKPRRRRRKNKSEECSGEGMFRKRKLSDEQVNMLEMSFRKEHKLESERKDKLAAELGLDPRQVAVWFQNRRARWKSKNLEEEYSKLKSENESTVLQKCHLQTELIKLKEQLVEAEKEIQRLSSERWDGFSSNSPSSSISMDAMQQQQEAPLFGVETAGLDNVFYIQQNIYMNGLEWDNLYYM